jgi:signal transduction histidine kinase
MAGVGTDLQRLFPGESDLARRMRAFDWKATPLGPPASWPEPLKHALGLCLTSRLPIILFWEPEQTLLYNDACIPLLGPGRHPQFLGCRADAAWRDIWHALGPMFQQVRSTREAAQSDHVPFSVGPILIESGAVGGYFCPFVEVTDRTAAERRREARSELSRVMRLNTLGELATSIAHEVNQPLAAIVANGQACARWLAADPPNLDEASAAVVRLVNDANRASDIIARIRAFLQRGSVQRVELRLEEIVSEVLAMVQGLMRSQSIAVQILVTPGVATVAADRIQLQQVVLNLVMNAVDAMRTITDRPRVLRLRVEPHGANEVFLGVEDTGIGVNPEDRDRIFEPFFTTKPTGVGMGLAMSRSIVESYGGRLWEAPVPDGALFHLVLPAANGGSVDGA